MTGKVPYRKLRLIYQNRRNAGNRVYTWPLIACTEERGKLWFNLTQNSMKYPKEQYVKLVNALSVLRKFIDLKSIHPAELHYIAYQQQSSGQRHNALVMVNGTVTRAHSVGNDDTYRILPIDDNFELYPNGCDDSHIVTAVNKALKELN